MTLTSSSKTLTVNNKNIIIRQFEITETELKNCLQLQHDTWGKHAGDVPLNLLKINLILGGIVAGAFDENDGCLGIIISMPGQFQNESAHWSYRLAVSPGIRELNLGAHLKEYQRNWCKSNGVAAIYWTYDPLQSKNAHFNINKLGAQITEYHQDFLPESSPELHLGMGGTDRFVVRWDVNQINTPPSFSLDDKNNMPLIDTERLGDLDAIKTPFKIEVPADIDVVKNKDPKESQKWRFETRTLFQKSLESGKKVVGFYRDVQEERSFYILQ